MVSGSGSLSRSDPAPFSALALAVPCPAGLVCAIARSPLLGKKTKTTNATSNTTIKSTLQMALMTIPKGIFFAVTCCFLGAPGWESEVGSSTGLSGRLVTI